MTRNNFSFAFEVEKLGLSKKDKILVAFSGGPDSTFLLLEAIKYFEKDSLFVAYVNYHDSIFAKEEEEIIDSFSTRHKIQIIKKNVFLPHTSKGFEANARNIRYNFFQEIVTSLNLKGVMVAHQENDDAETYLFQKKRNSISRTLGISQKSFIYGIYVYRPLLSLSKEFIVNHLKKESIPYFDDPTNKNPDRFRDKLRMGELSSMQDVKKVLSLKMKDLEEHKKTIKRVDAFFIGNEFTFERYRLLSKTEQKMFIFKCLQFLFPKENNDFIVSKCNLCYEFLKSNKTMCLPLSEDISLYKNKKDFFFGEKIKIGSGYNYELTESKCYDFGQLYADLKKREKLKINAQAKVLLRNVKRGDIIVTDIKGKDAFSFMKKHGVPLYLRSFYPALYNENKEIIYLPFFGDEYVGLKIKKYLPKC